MCMCACQGGGSIVPMLCSICSASCDQGQSEAKQSRQIFEAGQAIKLGIGGSLEMVKGSPGS